MKKMMSAFSYTILIIFFLWISGYAGFAFHVATMKPDKDPVKTDAIVVLTGGPGRINTGLDLLSAGKSRKLFISGVNRKVTDEKLLSLWHRDITHPPCCITLGHKAQNTIQNAQETKEWAAQESVSSIRLVTASYHMPRALLEFHHAMPNTRILPHPVKAPNGEAERHGFFLTTFGEYHKVILTALIRFHQIGEGVNITPSPIK